MLKVSYCDHPVFVVRESCIVNISPSKSYSFASVSIKLYQNVWRNNNSVKFEYGSCQVKISLKPCSHSTGHSFASVFMKHYQNICLDDISVKLEYGSCPSKTSSLGQILLKPCLPSSGHIFASIVMKLHQNVYLDNNFEYGLCRIKNLVTR